MTRKLLSLLAASAIALGALPPLSFAAETPVHTAAELREKGETLFTAPNTGDTTVADQPVASYWPGWVADENNSSVNYKYYAGFDDYVVQFYRDGRGTSLTSERAFFENDKNNSGLGRLIAPAAGYGRGADFVLLDFNLKVGDTGICYHDYYFRDTDGKLILAVRFDINGVWAALSASDKTNLGSLLEKNVNKRQPFSLAAWNNGDGGHGVSLEKDGVCVYTRELEGEINGFGSLDVVEGYYNADLTHTAIGGLKITAGMFGEAEPQQALDALDIPYNIDESYAFPAESLGRAVSWSGDRAVGPETKYSVVTASVDGVTKDFNIMLMGTDDDFAVAYTKMSPLSYDSREMAAVNSSMHLALRGEDGWEELNFGLGVLYAEADLDDGTAAGATRTLSAPELYRTEDGKIGVSAETRRLDGSDARNERWETEDLVHFTPVSGAAPAIDGSGRIRVNGVNGCVTGILRLSGGEADYLRKKLGEVKNTSVEPVTVTTTPNKAVTELPGLTANYSDGSTEVIPVEWNADELKAVDFSRNGAYTVTGKAAVADYASPMIAGRADPVIYKYNGKYYFISTDEYGNQLDLYLREADTIEGLASAQDIKIFEHRASGDMRSHNWAPELHEIGGKLRCLFASSTNGDWSGVQCRVITCEGEPTDIGAWSAPERITRANGEPLIAEGITLDMTYLEDGGRHYYIWAERPITAAGIGNSQLVIAEMDPSEPAKITTDPVTLRVPSYGWDRRLATVDEGPNVLKHGGKLYLTFSGSGVDPTYCLGLMTADEGGDLLNPESWQVTGYPVLASEHNLAEPGPGHNSFTKDEYGRDVLVVHYMPAGTNLRNMTAKTVHYGFDGEPVLYMTPDRYLRPEYRDVTATIYVNDGSVSDEELELQGLLSGLSFPDADNVRGHITVPETVGGLNISWASNDAAITPDGFVTRGETDKSVTLTATVERNGARASRDFEFTVKAKPAAQEKVGYIYAYFRGNVNGEREVQQIHLAISDDGLNWRDLNGNFPVIESTMGTRGLRDPYIIRSYEGDRFYLMATDLDANGGDWGSYGGNGSKYLMFWESDDLVNWSEQRMIKVSDDRMGCTWAPEAIYDVDKQDYLIYWASQRDDIGKKVIQCARTRDFRTFTEPEIFLGGEGYPSVIDTTMIYEGGKYYRITKNEESLSVFIEAADSLSGPYTRVASDVENIKGVEGPAIFKMIDGRCCLMLDGYQGENRGVGFFPLITDDIASGVFRRLTYGYKMPTGAKHGVMLAITRDEYDAVMEKWGPLPADAEGTPPEYTYTFEQDGADSEGELHGSAKIDGGVLTLDGSAGGYFSLPRGIFDRRDAFTVSMDVLVNTDKDFFFTFAVGDDTNDYFFLRTKSGSARAAMTISSNGHEEAVEAVNSVQKGEWHNYTVTATPDELTVYLDGRMLGESAVTKTLFHLGNNLSVNLGKSTWPNDSYFAGSYDNVKIYCRALSAAEVAESCGIAPEDYSLAVDAANKGVDISEDMYGIFFEDINYAADGGMYSEAVKNRSFEAAHCNPDRGEAYTPLPGQGWTEENASAEYLKENPLNENNPTYLRLTAEAGGGVANDCYGGFAVHEGESFNASVFARGDYDGTVTVSIVNGNAVLGSTSFSGFGEDFAKYSGVIETDGFAENATVRVTLSEAGALDLDMISVMSRDTFNGRENGLRKDIVQLLADMHPGFVRFPGGCVVEGYDLSNRYSWKDSVGPVESRRENWNRWQTGANAYDYCQTLGLGFYEYFLLCEDIGAEPLPVLSVGIGCQYQRGDASSRDDLYNIYIQDALDLIEFANGDPAESEWAKLRADMGHPEPFGLKYIGIGNEQWDTSDYSANRVDENGWADNGNNFFRRYEAFEQAIHESYPEMKLISTSGPNSEGIDFDNAWNWLREHKDDKNFSYAVDEHYYRAPEWFLANVNRYDAYDRESFKVFAGEYAANGAYGNTLYAALTEAAYMTGLEKNADVVALASYAPLLAKLGANQWAPDMIWFNNALVYGSPDYYVQSMYANNNGSHTLASELTHAGGSATNGVGVGTWLTSAKFRNITVTDTDTGQKTSVSPAGGSTGAWSASDGVISQTDTNVEGALAVAPISAKNYTLELEAMKTGGGEGFIIPFNYEDENNYLFWNIGGWSNARHAIQRVSDGAKTDVTAEIPGSVTENEWHKIKIEVSGDHARCYLDGALIHDQYIGLTKGPVYASASADDESGDIIIKLVNTSRDRAKVNIRLDNAAYINPTATAYILSGDRPDQTNSAGSPDIITTREELVDGVSDDFSYELGGLAFAVLRIHTKDVFAVSSETVECGLYDLPVTAPVNMSDGSVRELEVDWRVPKGGAFASGGVYPIEGKILGTNLYAVAMVTVDGERIEGYSAGIEGGKAVFTAETEATAAVAAYDSEGRLVSVKRRSFIGRLALDLPDAAEVRAYVWDKELRPLAPPAVEKAQ